MRRRSTVIALVVLALLAIGIALPALWSVRESSNRLHTNNNIKACALAVHTFHDNFGKLPNAFGPSIERETGLSLWFRLLPYVKADFAYQNEYRTGKIDAVVPEFLAPTDPSTRSRAGVVNFAANLRVFANKSIPNHSVVDTAAIVPQGTLLCGLTLARIADGTTNTIMLSTRYGDCAGQTTWYAAGVYGQCTLGPLPGPGLGGFMGAGSSTTPPTEANTPLTAMYQLVPTSAGCVPEPGVFGHSFQRLGMSIALCDSAVRNVAPTMSPNIFSRALCPADGFPISQPDDDRD